MAQKNNMGSEKLRKTIEKEKQKESRGYFVATGVVCLLIVCLLIGALFLKKTEAPEKNKSVASDDIKITYGSNIETLNTDTDGMESVTGIVGDITYENDPMDEDTFAPETDFMEMEKAGINEKVDEYLGYGFWKKNYINITAIVSEPVVSFYYSNTDAEPAGIYLYIPDEKMVVEPTRTDGVCFRGEARFELDRPLAEGTQLILLVNLSYDGQDLGSCYGFAQEKEEADMSDEYFGTTYFSDEELEDVDVPDAEGSLEEE